MITISQEAIFFFDDSGVLHKNEPSGFFVYAGYVFTDRNDLQAARHKYINANKKLKRALARSDELKAATLTPKHKRALYNSVREYDMVAVVVEISKIYDHILAHKKSICRFKDYALKRCVKNKLEQLLNNGTLVKDEAITISIYIDEQLTATNGYYDLRDSIKEELQHGIANFDYGKIHPHLFETDVSVNIHYCDSSKNYMIQASDILANKIWTSYRTNDKQLLPKDRLLILTLP